MGNTVESSPPFSGAFIEVIQNPVSGLQRELRHVRSNWRQENLPENWRYLDGTGFQTKPHIDMLYNSFSEFDNYFDRQKKISTWLSQTEEDIRGFNLEYLAEGLTFPLYYKPDFVQQKIVCPLYGGKEIEEIVSEEERNGSVKRAISERVKPFLLNSKDGSIAVMTSPSGWSGLKMENGKAIVFPDSQTYIWQKKGEEIVGFTIRTDFTLKEHREVIKRLTNEELPEGADVCDFVEKVCFLKGEENPGVEIKDIVNTMRYVRQDLSDGKKINAYKNRHWREIYADFANSDALWKFDEKQAEYVSELKDFVLSGDFLRRDLEEALAVTILRIAKNLRKDSVIAKPSSFSRDTRFDPREQNRVSWGTVLEEVEEKAGCAGGGGKGTLLDRLLNPTKYILSSISPRLASLEDEEEKYTFDEIAECRECGQTSMCGPCKMCRACDIATRRKNGTVVPDYMLLSA